MEKLQTGLTEKLQTGLIEKLKTGPNWKDFAGDKMNVTRKINICLRKKWRHCREKEKILFTSIFSELMSWPFVRCVSVDLCFNFFFKHLPLWNYLSDFDKIWWNVPVIVLFGMS